MGGPLPWAGEWHALGDMMFDRWREDEGDNSKQEEA